MLVDQMRAAIAGARASTQLDQLMGDVWQAHGAGLIDDDQAQDLAEQLQARRRENREKVQPIGLQVRRSSIFPQRRPITSPDRIASRDRRRLLAASGPMPPALAARFTTGQLAVLKVIADEVARIGACALCVDALAARAGVCRRLAQIAIRLAEGDGLIAVQERRYRGRKNETNLIGVVSPEWLAWISRGRRAVAPKSIGCRTVQPTVKGVQLTKRTAWKRPKKSPGRESSISVPPRLRQIAV